MRIKLETDHEKEYVRRAALLGCYAFKFEIAGRRGATDRITLCPGGKVVFIEFKRPGLEHNTTQQQKSFHKILTDLDIPHCIASTAAQGIDFLLGVLSDGNV